MLLYTDCSCYKKNVKHKDGDQSCAHVQFVHSLWYIQCKMCCSSFLKVSMFDWRYCGIVQSNGWLPQRSPPPHHHRLRDVAGWVRDWTCSWAASLQQRGDERLHDGSQFCSHPLLSHCLHTVHVCMMSAMHMCLCETGQIHLHILIILKYRAPPDPGLWERAQFAYRQAQIVTEIHLSRVSLPLSIIDCDFKLLRPCSFVCFVFFLSYLFVIMSLLYCLYRQSLMLQCVSVSVVCVDTVCPLCLTGTVNISSILEPHFLSSSFSLRSCDTKLKQMEVDRLHVWNKLLQLSRSNQPILAPVLLYLCPFSE